MTATAQLQEVRNQFIDQLIAKVWVHAQKRTERSDEYRFKSRLRLANRYICGMEVEKLDTGASLYIIVSNRAGEPDDYFEVCNKISTELLTAIIDYLTKIENETDKP